MARALPAQLAPVLTFGELCWSVKGPRKPFCALQSSMCDYCARRRWAKCKQWHFHQPDWQPRPKAGTVPFTLAFAVSVLTLHSTSGRSCQRRRPVLRRFLKHEPFAAAKRAAVFVPDAAHQPTATPAVLYRHRQLAPPPYARNLQQQQHQWHSARMCAGIWWKPGTACGMSSLPVTLLRPPHGCVEHHIAAGSVIFRFCRFDGISVPLVSAVAQAVNRTSSGCGALQQKHSLAPSLQTGRDSRCWASDGTMPGFRCAIGTCYLFRFSLLLAKNDFQTARYSFSLVVTPSICDMHDRFAKPGVYSYLFGNNGLPDFPFSSGDTLR